MNNASELISENIINIGTKAEDNPTTLEGLENYSLGITNKDYPAKTPLLWNTCYRKFGLKTRNVRTFGNVQNIREIFATLREDPKYIGGDVGVGFKDKAPAFVEELDPLAKNMGAINVIVKTARGLKGYNTDGFGYAESLAAKLAEQNKKLDQTTIVLLGAGGTTNAIAFALADRGAWLRIFNRTESKAIDLANRLNNYFGKEIATGDTRDILTPYLEGAKVDAIVSIIDDPHSPLDQFNALGPIELPTSPEAMARNKEVAVGLLQQMDKTTIISDVMLRSQDTATIAAAKELGLPTLDGVPMVVNQAIEAFWLVNQQALEAAGITKNQVAETMRSIS